MKKIKIERGIPLALRQGQMDFPFKNMKVGDSFLLPAGCGPDNVRGAATQRKVRVAIRKTPQGYRCWRIK